MCDNVLFKRNILLNVVIKSGYQIIRYVHVQLQFSKTSFKHTQNFSELLTKNMTCYSYILVDPTESHVCTYGKFRRYTTNEIYNRRSCTIISEYHLPTVYRIAEIELMVTCINRHNTQHQPTFSMNSWTSNFVLHDKFVCDIRVAGGWGSIFILFYMIIKHNHDAGQMLICLHDCDSFRNLFAFIWEICD